LEQIERTPEPQPVSFFICRPEDRRFILLAAILASALGFIDGSIVAIAMPVMRHGLNATLTEAQWIGGAYLLAMSSLVLMGGAMGDRFGVARVFGAGIAVFVAASMACAAAQSAEWMIVARVLQGVGAGFMVPGSMAIIGRAYPPETRGRAIGIWAAAASATTVAGPILGGLVLELKMPGAWRWIFALNLPLGAVALWLLWTRTRPDPGRPGTPIDFLGAVLGTVSLGLFAYGLTEAAWIWAGGGAVLAVAFLVHEARIPAPMLRLSLFADRAFAAANLATLFLFFALAAVMFYLPMTAVTAWGARGVDVTLALLPLGLMIGLFSTPAGRLADRIGAGPLVAAGSLLVALADAGLALFATAPGMYTHVLPMMALKGAGMSLVAAPLSAAVMAAAGATEQGAASGINNAVARVANLMAVALMGTVAASAYTAAGGLDSFAANGNLGDAHRIATASGFAAVAWVAALSSMIAAIGIRRT
jgi:EmrB/QacA subfamily drug resistance transporter